MSDTVEVTEDKFQEILGLAGGTVPLEPLEVVGFKIQDSASIPDFPGDERIVLLTIIGIPMGEDQVNEIMLAFPGDLADSLGLTTTATETTEPLEAQ